MEVKAEQMQKTISELNKIGYVYRHKPIRFNGLPTMSTPQREGDYMDNFDTFFSSKEKFDTWHRKVTIGLAELDESMKFCKYFIREKGNDGHYVREGKKFKVNGSWVGITDFDNYSPTKNFVKWLEDNGWRDNWFELMPQYI